jgi:hypothetical protein
MEFSHEEKERIIAEEKLRHETRKELLAQGGGKGCGNGACGSGLHGSCHCGAFWKGLILGLILSALFGFIFNRHYGMDRCLYGSTMMQNQAAPDATQK